MKFYFYSVLFSCFLLESHYTRVNISLVHQHKDDKTLRIFILSRRHLNFYKCDQKLFSPAQGNPFLGRFSVLRASAYMRNAVQKCFLKAPRWSSCQCQPLWGIWEGNEQTCQCLCWMGSSGTVGKAVLCSTSASPTALPCQWRALPGLQQQWVAVPALAQLPGQNTEVWGCFLSLCSLLPARSSLWALPPAPPCSHTDHPCGSTLVIPAPRVGALLDSGSLVPEILTPVIPTSPIH